MHEVAQGLAIHWSQFQGTKIHNLKVKKPTTSVQCSNKFHAVCCCRSQEAIITPSVVEICRTFYQFRKSDLVILPDATHDFWYRLQQKVRTHTRSSLPDAFEDGTPGTF